MNEEINTKNQIRILQLEHALESMLDALSFLRHAHQMNSPDLEERYSKYEAAIDAAAQTLRRSTLDQPASDTAQLMQLWREATPTTRATSLSVLKGCPVIFNVFMTLTDDSMLGPSPYSAVDRVVIQDTALMLKKPLQDHIVHIDDVRSIINAAPGKPFPKVVDETSDNLYGSVEP